MKQISKILLLTFVLSMLIIPTCFAMTDNEKILIDDYLKDYVAKNKPSLSNANYLLRLSSDYGSYKKFEANYFSSNVLTDYTDTTVFYNRIGQISFFVNGYDTGNYTISSVSVNGNITGTGDIDSINIVNISYLPVDFVNSDGEVIVQSTETPPEPELPDIPAISLPNSDKSKNYYFMYANNSGSTGLAVWSSDNEIIFDAVSDNNAAYIDFTFTSPMNYSNYILRDNEWIILENANYDEAGTKNVNIGYKTILSSSFNVYSEDGTIFFPVTPLLEEIAGAGLTEMWETIMKAVMVILMIAVSLLALWISLIVLLKVLRTYLA